MPMKYIKVLGLKKDKQREEVVAKVLATSEETLNGLPVATAILQVRIPTIQGEHYRASKQRAHDEALMFLDLFVA